MRQAIRLCLVVIAVVLIAQLPTRVLAAAPQIQVIPIDRTFVSPYSSICGFTIMQQVQGTVRLLTFTDSSGTTTRTIRDLHLVVTFSANDKTLTGQTNGPDITTYNADGSITIHSDGTGRLTTASGQGVVLGGTGRTVVTIAPDGTETVTQDVGLRTTDFTAFCAAMS